MPITPHAEKHFNASATVRDLVIGMSDGLTVPFALAAGLSGAAQASGVIVTAGLAEIAAGAIAMGLGGFLAARSDAEHYVSEESRERAEVKDKPREEEVEIEREFAGTQNLAMADAVVPSLPGAAVDYVKVTQK